MDLRHNRPLRIISTIVLVFFFWTFGGGVQIAYAFKDGSGLLVTTGDEKKNRKHEEKLQKTLEEIEGILTDARTDTGTKKDKIKTKKGEIDSLDADIKKRFQETEKKLYDEKLPLEIVERHYKFVRHYEDNLKELKNNIDNIEKAKTKAEVDSAIEMTKAHLEKAKPPKRHVPLDPNKLPNRAAEPAEVTLIEISAKEQEAFPAASKAVQAASLPTSADLSETIEVQFTTEIKAKAQELNYNPVKIYNWVRNNIEFVPTYGSIQGANYCLQTKQCNAFDTASLLIALLRTSGIHARYVSGTIEIPIEKVKNWAGGFTDANAALTLIASGGIPLKGLISGGKIAAARMEHVWVEAYVPYGNYRGTMRDDGIKTWIPMDGSFKQYNYLQGLDFQAITGFDAESFLKQIQSTASIDPITGSVTNIDSLAIQKKITQLQTQIRNYINTNMPDATVRDAFGGKAIIPENLGLLPSTLPYKKVAILSKYSVIPDNLRHKISFSLLDEYGTFTVLSVTKTLPELAFKKITLSYAPASSSDEALIKSYADKEATNYPAYLINLKPEFKIDGAAIATGETIRMGKSQSFTMTFSGPSQKTDNITNSITSGSFNAIGLDLGIIPHKSLLDSKTRLEAVKSKIESGTLAGITKEDLMGEILHQTAINYFAQLDVYNSLNQTSAGVVSIRLPSEGITAFELGVSYLWGIPISATFGGLSIDVDRDISITVSKGGDQTKEKQFVINKGMFGSAMEHSIMEQLFGTRTDPAYGVSAVKIISLANNAGIPIYTIDKNNISQIMPLLQVSQEIKTDIQNAVNAGKTVTVPKTNINYHGWQGIGYIAMDMDTGAAAYMIDGGIAGGWGILAGLLSVLLAKYGIALSLGFILGSPAWVMFLGALLVGLAVGLLLSQVLSDSAKAELRQIAIYVIENWLLQLLSIMGANAVWLLVFAVYIALIVLPFIVYYSPRREQIAIVFVGELNRDPVKI